MADIALYYYVFLTSGRAQCLRSEQQGPQALRGSLEFILCEYVSL